MSYSMSYCTSMSMSPVSMLTKMPVHLDILITLDMYKDLDLIFEQQDSIEDMEARTQLSLSLLTLKPGTSLVF